MLRIVQHRARVAVVCELDWSPAIIITNAPAKAPPGPPASLLLNGASLNAK